MSEQEIVLHSVEFAVCELCLTAAGGECHVPGCTFWMADAPIGSDLAWLRERRAAEPARVDWPARFRAAAEVADALGCEGTASDFRDIAECMAPHVVEAIGRALLGEGE